jgi:hypothetical protein
MPIRKRGNSWQIDIRLADGSRIRRTAATEEQAREIEQALKPTPQQRAAARKKRSRQPSARKSSTGCNSPAEGSSSQNSVPSKSESLQQPELAKPAMLWPEANMPEQP